MIRFDQLSRRYGPLTAVDSLSLEVRAGEVYALLGPNGAGKTTALRCLATLLRPTSGTASGAGVDVRTDPVEARRRIAFLAQKRDLAVKTQRTEFRDNGEAGLTGSDDDDALHDHSRWSSRLRTLYPQT